MVDSRPRRPRASSRNIDIYTTSTEPERFIVTFFFHDASPRRCWLQAAVSKGPRHEQIVEGAVRAFQRRPRCVGFEKRIGDERWKVQFGGRMEGIYVPKVDA